MSSELEAKLAQLKRLHELGLLTDAAYQQQQTALLSSAMGTTPVAPSAPSLSGATMVGTAPAVSAPAPAGPLAGPTTVDPTAGLPSRLGNYRVLGLIGTGGMATVVRARHDSEGWARQQGGDVALKLIHPHIAADPSFQERFFAEAALGKRVHHPGLATVYDVISEGPWLGTILEYVDGRELSEWVRPGGLPVDDVVSLLTPLADALDHLHNQGIVHRDLKPANVKVRPDGQPVLLDLGIAKDLLVESGGQTKTMTTMGTSAWMAPEQADAKSVTAAADVYAFALVAYALLSGRMPWGAEESELRVLTNKMMGKLAPLSSVAAGVPDVVSAVVMGALSVDVGARPSSCGALVTSLMAPPDWEQFSVGGERFRLRRVAAGTYTVGSRDDDEGAYGDEKPRHSVRSTRAYGIGEFAVTQGLYEAVMGTNPSHFSDESDSTHRPVEKVSWIDAVAFCNRLSKRCGLAPAYRISGEDVRCDFNAPGFRLPTEHEWEVAARADTDLTYAGSKDLGSVGWFMDNSGGETHPVGQKAPNGWGLYDLSGNVWEWCWDWVDYSAYQSGTMTDPVGPQSGASRVSRGGSWNDRPRYARVAVRGRSTPGTRNRYLGLRLVRKSP